MRTALLLVAALLSSGCISALASDVPDPSVADPSASQSPMGADAGTPATHGAPQRTDSPVTVTLGTNGFTAAKDVTVRNDFGGAGNARTGLGSRNGGITVSAWDQGGYLLAAHLEGGGSTEQEARAALDTLAVVTQDSLSGGVLDLGLLVKFNDPAPPAPTPLPIQLGDSLRRSASIVASLPAGPAEMLQASTTNGGVKVDGLHGPSLTLDSTNGDLTTGGSWDQARLDTTNGAIHLAGTTNDLDASSTNGAIDGTLESSRSSHQSVATTNGNVSLKVKAGDHGYALDGQTTNGRVSFDVGSAHASGKGHQQARTAGYEDAAVQVALTLDSTNGDVSARAA
jgi:hypothetical protein